MLIVIYDMFSREMTSWCNLCQSCFSVFGEVNNNSINQSRSRYRAPVEIALGIYKLQGPRLTYALTATKLVVTVVLQTLTHLLFLNENL